MFGSMATTLAPTTTSGQSRRAATSSTTSTALTDFDENIDNELLAIDLQAIFINESLFIELDSQSNQTEFPLLPNYTHTLNFSSSILIEMRRRAHDARVSAEMLSLARTILMAIVLIVMIIVTIIGNVFVIAAIILERNLQNVSNYLVASLAVADLFVACLVMPLGAVYELSNGWILGPELCDIWTACDVLCCTASILHLVAIASDRYWTVTNIDYNNLRTPCRVFTMIFCVWFAALIVSLAPHLGWKDADYMKRIEEQHCMVSQNVAYQIFATCCTFYVPLLVILFLYWKIYLIARNRIQRRMNKFFNMTVTETECNVTTRDLSKQQRKRRAEQAKQADQVGPTAAQVEQRMRKRMRMCFRRGNIQMATTTELNAAEGSGVTRSMAAMAVDFASMAITREETEFSTSNYDNKSHAGTELTTISSDADEFRTSNANEIVTLSQQVSTQQHMIATHLSTITPLAHSIAMGGSRAAGEPSSEVGGSTSGRGVLASIANPHQKLAKRRQMLEAKRERKAAQTLAIITGAFVMCWLPFFASALTQTLCKTCILHPALSSLFLWLGYFNSTLNPIIYTIFNPEFRRAFKRMLFGRQQAAQGRNVQI